jgi:glycosyltransferase involved in cell wall biosynthesis
MNIGEQDISGPARTAVPPVISVVIPTYNRSQFIARALQTCLSQRGAPPLEIIVVDDCSTDATAEIVAGFNDQVVIYIRLDRNLGGAVARNAGIDAARGAYLAFLDSDDTWESEKLKTQLDAIAASPDHTNTVCHTQVRVCGSGADYYLPGRAKRPQETVAEYLFLNHGHIQTSSLLLPTTLAKRTRFDPTLRKHQDYDFCLRLEDNGAHFLLVRHPLVHWYHDARADRITRRYGIDASRNFLDARRARLGTAASAAFWVEQIFPQELEKAPVRAMSTFVQTLMAQQLPLSWYPRWIYQGLKRRLRRLVDPRCASAFGSTSH